ncbi:SDR family NAD(P)-dependent oxidoreductase [Flavobacterium pallidum]|uniref:SDR family NAD(P)-dependent oxidoreductase n=1 Tax=Flavobacterium pallidum TaxID=2172098 RepID=UPI001C625B53|nr:SDR family oxidoreductase [Flavobacterium pallidum]
MSRVNYLKTNQHVKTLRLNAIGAFNVIKAYKSNLQQGNDPAIVLFSSVAAGKGMPFHTGVSMSKGAVEGLTLALAAELSPKIRVNCIAPSLTDTSLAEPLLNSEAKRVSNAERHPLKRIGIADGIADLALFLLAESKWMTGQVIGLNGGLGTIIK